MKTAFENPFRSRKSWLCVVLLVAGCAKDEPASELFELLPSSHTGIDFRNEVVESVELNIVTFEMIYNGAGVVAADFNNDGLQDLFFASNMGKSRLYINQGDYTFRDITETSGIDTEGKWANGVTVTDINGDGFPDLYISFGGPYAEPRRRANELYINNGDLTFTERAEEYALADTGFSTQSVFFDYNKDGYPDLFVLTNGQGETPPNVIRPKQINGEHITTDRLYRNNGDGTFTNVSAEAGILIEGYGLGVNVLDINGDGWPDIHAANDFLPNDVLYLNNGDGTFTDRAADYFPLQSYSSMGTDFGDINNDGLMDLIVVDMLPENDALTKRMNTTMGYERSASELAAGYTPQVKRNVLQLNRGSLPGKDPLFSDIALLAGVAATDWSWSALFADFDNDGYQDLTVTNGIPRNPADADFSDHKMNLLRVSGFNRQTMETLFQDLQDLEGSYLPNKIFRNNGDLTFTDKSESWGFRTPTYSTGAVYVDLNNNGLLDLVINNTFEPASVYRNIAGASGNSYLSIKLTGNKQNSLGIGATITIYAGGGTYHQYNSVARGYLSAMAAPLHFGMGEHTHADSVVVIWPDDTVQTIENVAVNQRIEVVQQNAAGKKVNWDRKEDSSALAEPLFREVSEEKGVMFTHQEEDFIDFRIQPLLPHKFSKLGPGIAVGDVNRDGLDDFFVGGGFGQPAELFIQNPDGTFTSNPLEHGESYEKDMGALFLDINGDGFIDLYVGSGGSEFRAGSEYYRDRVYFGDGEGVFTLQSGILPDIRTSTSVVIATDFDRDGSKELFIGSRVLPNQYPLAPESYILKYREGAFTDITDQVAPGLRKIGMVTSAIWTDFNNDSWPDLMVVGEWMPLTVFENRQGVLHNVTRELGLAETTGWWNSIVAGDFNRDGYMDYVAGNLGLNTLLQNRTEGPVQIHYGDFNQDGLIDPVISRIINGVRKPVHLKDDLLLQMPVLSRRFTSYKEYGSAALTDLLSTEHLNSGQTYSSDTFQTSLVMNMAGERMEVSPLPVEAQFAPVFGMLSGDYDGDGIPDLLVTGNSYSTEMFTGWYDASKGLYLKGDGAGGFTPVRLTASGFHVLGDAKSLTELRGADNKKLILSARNDDTLLLFESSLFYHNIDLKNQEESVLITWQNGETEKREFYDGGGYLSQKGRTLSLIGPVENVLIFDGSGNSRTWVPE